MFRSQDIRIIMKPADFKICGVTDIMETGKASSRLFYKFIKMTKQQDLFIFNG